jgi:hypothetical protein
MNAFFQGVGQLEGGGGHGASVSHGMVSPW